MYELRVVALSEDARYVVLAPVLEGRRERYRVAVDDRLRSALRGELGRLERKIRPDSALTPREIQARVRAGETAETIAAAAGVAVEWVLRFETPVLAERAQVARQARHSSLSVSGGEWTGVPLEEIVAARLETDGHRAEVADWDAWRREDGRWVLQLRVAAFTAHWLWDPSLQRLVVHDDAARSLLQVGGGEPSLAEPRRLALAPRPSDPPALEPEVVLELRSEIAEPDGLSLDTAPEEDAGLGMVGSPDATEDPREDPADPGTGASATLGTAEPAVDPLVADSPAADSPADGPPTADPAKVRRSGRRKSVPSWEDILLGTGGSPATDAGTGSRSG